jgi:hypothetical protein
MKRNEKELIEYIVLLVGLLVFFLLLIIFRYESFALKMVAMLGSLFYVVWGIIHHAADSRLTKSVILEYMFISSMVFLLFYLVLSV